MMNEYSLKRRRSGAMDNAQVPSSLMSSSKRRKLDNVVSASPENVNELKADGFETDYSLFFIEAFSKETTQSSKGTMMNSPKKKKKKSSTASSAVAVSTPPAAEIEEFFSIAEKFEQKRFAEKFNYDVVKDVPLQGKYQWVKLKP